MSTECVCICALNKSYQGLLSEAHGCENRVPRFVRSYIQVLGVKCLGPCKLFSFQSTVALTTVTLPQIVSGL
jgi:hypothetical protein